MTTFTAGSRIRASRTEKRAFYRMRVHAEVTYQQENVEETLIGECHDLSGGGLSFTTGTRIQLGERLIVQINSTDQRFQPLEARLEVLRVEMLNNKFLVAGSFTSVNH
ncbi:MAG TPA: PilZ domain-containing protein [Gammaproteobacteria bacterium]|nr:PilZ domain-containing protein [Gammaproteobacteria bacterium]